MIRVWPLPVDTREPVPRPFELTHHRVAQAGELRETVAGYRACLTLSGPVLVAWKSEGREDRRELLAGDLCMESPGDFRWVRWDAPFTFLRLEISLGLMRELTVGGEPAMASQRGLRDADLSLLMQMLRAAATRVEARAGDRLYCDQLGRTMAAYLYERYCTSPAHGHAAAPCLPGKVLKEVLALIDERIGGAIGVEALAAHAGMSQFYFSRLFRNTVGQSPAQYVLDRRMRRAKLLLEDEKLSLAEVARRTGDSSKSSFTSAFRARNGQTPARYRRTLP